MARAPITFGAPLTAPPQIVQQPGIALGALQTPRMVAQQAVRNPVSNNQVLVDVLSQGVTAPIEGGGGASDWLQGLVRGGEAYFRAKAAREGMQQDRADALREEQRGYDVAQARRDALMAMNGSQDPQQGFNAMTAALSGADPEMALSLGADRLGQRLQSQDERSNYLFQQDDQDQRAPARQQLENDSALYQRGYRPDGTRFGPAADDWAINQAQLGISRANAATARMGAAQRGQGSLSRGEESRITQATEAAARGRNIRNLVSEFRQLNQRVPTGRGSFLTRPDQWFNADRQRMAQLTDMLTPMMREPGSGAMSDGDRLMFRNAVPNLESLGPANEAAGLAMEQAAQNMEDYALFLDQYGQGGDLAGAETQWAQYLNANPVFDADGRVRAGRPTFSRWLEMGGPDMSQTQGVAPTDRRGGSQGAAPQARIRRYNPATGVLE